MKVRQSNLKQFGTCARQFYYSQILQLEPEKVGSLTVLGTVWHYAVDTLETYRDLDLAIRTFRHYWSNPELLGETIDYWHRQTTFHGLEKRGVSMLRRYHELSPWHGGILLGTEIHFEVPLGRHTLEGTIDKLYARPQVKGLDCIDFKTGSAVPEKLRANLQFTSYTYATTRPEFWAYVPGHEGEYERFKDYKRQGWWYHARNNKMFNAGYRGNLDYQRLLLAVNAMEEAIENNIFPLDISGVSCGYCPFFEEICGSEVENPTWIGRETDGAV